MSSSAGILPVSGAFVITEELGRSARVTGRMPVLRLRECRAVADVAADEGSGGEVAGALAVVEEVEVDGHAGVDQERARSR